MTQSLEDLKKKYGDRLVMDMSWINRPDYAKYIYTLIEQVYHARTEEVVKIAGGIRPKDIEPRQHNSYNDGKRDFADDFIATLTPKISNDN